MKTPTVYSVNSGEMMLSEKICKIGTYRTGKLYDGSLHLLLTDNMSSIVCERNEKEMSPLKLVIVNAISGDQRDRRNGTPLRF